jgi:hypothetical protein
MKRKALTITLVLAFLFSVLATGDFVHLGAANPFHEERWADPPIISIHSPVNGSCVNKFLLNFTVTKPDWWVGTPGIYGHAQTFTRVSYRIDGKYYGSVRDIDRNLTSPLNYFEYLTNLTDGAHSLTVQAFATGSVWEKHGLWDYTVSVNSSSVMYFTLDTTLPSVSILSLENKTYHTANFTLAFTVDEPISLMSYSLDGVNVTVTGNSTLTGLSYGEHNVTVYATDIAGNVGVSETVNFTIAEEAKPLPMAPVAAASVAAVAVVGVGLLVYLEKRKR